MYGREKLWCDLRGVCEERRKRSSRRMVLLSGAELGYAGEAVPPRARVRDRRGGKKGECLIVERVSEERSVLGFVVVVEVGERGPEGGVVAAFGEQSEDLGPFRIVGFDVHEGLLGYAVEPTKPLESGRGESGGAGTGGRRS